MKTYLKKFKAITLSSLLSMIVYIFTYWMTSAFMNDSTNHILALIIYSIFFMSAFSLVYIYLTYIRDGSGEECVLEEYKSGYAGLIYDMKSVFKQELSTFYTLLGINFSCWLLTSLDKLLFGKRTITSIFLIYSPLNIIGVVLPTWLNSVLSYIVGSVSVFAIYLLELVVFRRNWYKKYNKLKYERK